MQPHCYGSLCAVIFCQMLYYDKKWRWYSACGAFAVYAVVCSGFEVGMVYASKVRPRCSLSLHATLRPH